MQVKVWDVDLYVSHDVAKAQGGSTTQSQMFEYHVSTSPTPPPSDLVMWNLRRAVSEPSAIVLRVLGLSVMLVFRRGK
jgi:hypothetical protein